MSTTPRVRETILASVTDDREVLVTTPDGRMGFMGFWQAIKFCWFATFRGYRVEVEDE